MMLSWRRRRRRRRLLSFLQQFLLLLVLILLTGGGGDIGVLQVVEAVEAAVPCVNNTECDTSQGYECLLGRCTKNTFERGCFVHKLPKDPYYGTKQRVCNSDDVHQLASDEICRPLVDDSTTSTNHLELRMHSQNWEAAFFEVWILQIILSELLDVPTTIETGLPNISLNFYDPHAPFEYGLSSDYQATVRAHDVGDCRDLLNPHTSQEEEGYQSCAHTVTEVWDAETEDILTLLEDGILEKPQVLGVLGEEALFVPKFTIERDPTLLSYLGLAGEKNRRKLAETFLRPTTWGEYCTLVSSNNCSTPDGVAAYPPNTTEEATRMFVEDGVYIGHFRNTTQNDCDTHPHNCTGHVGDYPCGWPSFVEQQMYHLDIALQSDGPELNSKGYSYQQLFEMWHAANATKSNVMMMWYKPELNYQTFLHTDAEYTKVVLPPRTQECIDARISIEDRCKEDPAVRRGVKEGACDKDVQQLHKLIVSNLYGILHDESIPEGRHSPAYEVVSLFTMMAEHLGQMFDLWQKLDDPRDAVCTWVVNNMELINKFIPRSYPRVFVEKDELSVLMYVSVILSLIACIGVVVTCAAVYHQRDRRVMKVAQVEFLWLLLGGLLCITSGAVLSAVPPTDPICVANMWLINVGYTLELVPLIIKVAAINRLMHAAKKMKRVMLDRKKLFAAVGVILVIVVAVSIVWTVVDPPKKQAEYTLTEDQTSDGDTIVLVQYSCQSDNLIFDYLNLAWTSMLLLIATILAFQARNLRQDFNESQTLGIMIYSHFLFVLLRMITFFLESSSISGPILSRARSMIYSLDAIGTIGIYFFPKLISKDVPDSSIVSFTSGANSHSNNNPHHIFLMQNQQNNFLRTSNLTTAKVEITEARTSNISALSGPGEQEPVALSVDSFADDGSDDFEDDDDENLAYKMEEAPDDDGAGLPPYTFSSEGIHEARPKSVSFSDQEGSLTPQVAAVDNNYLAEAISGDNEGQPSKQLSVNDVTAGVTLVFSSTSTDSQEATPRDDQLAERAAAAAKENGGLVNEGMHTEEGHDEASSTTEMQEVAAAAALVHMEDKDPGKAIPTDTQLTA